MYHNFNKKKYLLTFLFSLILILVIFSKNTIYLSTINKIIIQKILSITKNQNEEPFSDIKINTHLPLYVTNKYNSKNIPNVTKNATYQNSSTFINNLSTITPDQYWRSPRIDGTVTSLAIGDIDNDGKNELLVLLPNSLRIYRLTGEIFQLIHEIKNGPDGTYLFVDIANVKGNTKEPPQIFISNRQARSISSFVLQAQPEENNIKIIARDLPYYFRVQPNPIGEGVILLGQKAYLDEAFSGPIYEIGHLNNSFVPIRKLNLPSGVNIYNSVQADLNGTGKPQTVMITLNFSLRVFTPNGEECWTSAETYASSSKHIELDPRAGRGWGDSIWYYLPTRLILSNLNKDNRYEIIVVRNEDRTNGMISKTKIFYQGTIYSLFWNGIAMQENWSTPNISGYLTDYAVGDVGNVGNPALVMSVSQLIGSGLFEKGISNIVAFNLKSEKLKLNKPGL